MAQGKPFTAEDKERIIRSLKPYLELGYSRNKACELIGLAPTTLSEWVKDSPGLRIELQSWENTVNAMVMANIVDAIRKEGELEDDIRKENSWKWAERRMKQDFSLKTENEHIIREAPKPLLDALHSDVHHNDSNSQDSETQEEN